MDVSVLQINSTIQKRKTGREGQEEEVRKRKTGRGRQEEEDRKRKTGRGRQEEKDRKKKTERGRQEVLMEDETGLVHSEHINN